MNFLEGQVLSFDKPLGMTSFGLVARVRKMLTARMGGRKIKVGHAGTLDPLATGVVVLCTGKATKRIEEIQSGEKEYEALLRLGATTPSFDLEHPVDHTYPTSHITESLLRETLRSFEGDILQVPPVFSACKVDGKRAYDMARRGKEVELKAKPLHISSISLDAFDPEKMEAAIKVTCGKGTYVRALARDIGQALGSGAHLAALRRTRVGDHALSSSFTLDSFKAWLAAITVETELPAPNTDKSNSPS